MMEEEDFTDSEGDTWEDKKEKSEAFGLIDGVHGYIKETDEELEYSRLESLISLFKGWKEEISRHVNVTHRIKPTTAQELEKMMDRVIERKKNLPPYDPDRLGLNKPFMLLPEPFCDFLTEKDYPKWAPLFMYDPKTKSYINPSGSEQAIKEQSKEIKAKKSRSVAHIKEEKFEK